MASATSLPIGEEVDRYIVEAQLGEGGVAVVYRVRHRMLQSLHALKLLKQTSPEQRQRLAAEGRAQAALRHPNIVRVTDVVERGDALGLIVDYVAGPTLEERLAQGPLPLAEAVSIGRGIIEGVAAAHAAGIVHRDLKPANVLLTASPSGSWQPHVADFGIAKALDTTNGPTRAGLGMGTPGYMAPEQYHNAAGVDHRADIFSLGCLLYELVCGRPPFLGDSVVEVFQLAARGDYPFPRDLRPELPLRLAHALEEALAPVPDRRFADCAELLSAWSSEADPDAGPGRAAKAAPAPGEHTFDFDAPRPRPRARARPPAAATATMWSTRSSARAAWAWSGGPTPST
jgi:serine/threonine-protein kinase